MVTGQQLAEGMHMVREQEPMGQQREHMLTEVEDINMEQAVQPPEENIMENNLVRLLDLQI